MSSTIVWQICCAVVLALVAIQSTAEGVDVNGTAVETPVNLLAQPVALSEWSTSRFNNVAYVC